MRTKVEILEKIEVCDKDITREMHLGQYESQQKVRDLQTIIGTLKWVLNK